MAAGEGGDGGLAARQAAWRATSPGEAVVAEPPRRLSELENWRLDTQGYLLVPSVASTAQLGEPAALDSHPTLLAYAEDLCGLGYRRDLPVRDVSELGGGLVGGDSRTRDPAREYVHTGAGYILAADDQEGFTDGYSEHVHVRQCQGLLAVWALADIAEGDGFAVVPCSHLAEIEPPAALNWGEDLPGPLSVISQPAMRAGDLLLLAEATMHGVVTKPTPGRQLVCGFIARTAPPSVGSQAVASGRSMTPHDPAPFVCCSLHFQRVFSIEKGRICP